MTCSLHNGKHAYHLEISEDAHWNLVRLGAQSRLHNEDYAESVIEAHALATEPDPTPSAAPYLTRSILVNTWGFTDLEDVILTALVKSGYAISPADDTAIKLALSLAQQLTPSTHPSNP